MSGGPGGGSPDYPDPVASAVLNLTTTFTPQPSCFASTFTISTTTAAYSDLPLAANDTINPLFTYSGYTDATYAVTRGYHSGCFPPGFESLTQRAGNVPWTAFSSYFSPGACPAGFTSNLASFVNLTTFVTCCPSALPLYVQTSNNGPFGCMVSVPYDQGSYEQATIVNGSQTSTMTVGAVYGLPVFVAFQPSDVSLFSTVSATAATGKSALTSQPVATTGPSTTSRYAATSTAPMHPKGLSRSASIGVGVGVTLGAVALLALGALLWRRRRKSRKEPAEQSSPFIDKPELSGESKEQYELSEQNALERKHGINRDVHEMNATARPAELDRNSVVAELQGDWRGWEAPTSH